jgi:hypothetical protein
MSARDRRVIHVSLAKFPGVSTRSEGEGNDRRLQIIPARGSRGGERDDRPRDRDRGAPRGPGRPGEGRGPRPVRDRAPAQADDRARQPAYDAPAPRNDYDAPVEREYDAERDYDDRP